MEILCVVLLPVAVGVLMWWLIRHRLAFSREPIDRAEVTEEDYGIPLLKEEELEVPVASGEVGRFLVSVAEALDGGLTESQAEVLTLRIAAQKVNQVVSGTYFVKAGGRAGKLGVWAFRERAAEVIFLFRGEREVLGVVGGVGVGKC